MIHETNKLAVGYKQTRRAVIGGDAVKVIIARDADEKITAPLLSLCERHGVETEFADTMSELGNLCGIEVRASSAVILK